MALEKHYDSEPLATGTHKGANNTLTIYDPGKDFKSCGVVPGLYIENETDGSAGLVTAVTEDTVTCTLARGSGDDGELVTNGTDWTGADGGTDAPAGWTNTDDPSFTTKSISSGALCLTSAGGESEGIYQELAVVAGRFYTASGIGRRAGAGVAKICIGTEPGAFDIASVAVNSIAAASMSVSFVPPTDAIYLSLVNANGVGFVGDKAYFDDVSVEGASYFLNTDTYNIYKTSQKDSLLSTHHVDRRFGTKVFKRSDLNTHGHLVDDEDIDIDNPGKVFGPGQPER